MTILYDTKCFKDFIHTTTCIFIYAYPNLEYLLVTVNISISDSKYFML